VPDRGRVVEPLHFRENGSKDRDAIVFVHGGGMTGLGWQTALQTIPEYYCLAPDLPDAGQSAHITPLTLENAVEGLADLIRAIRSRRSGWAFNWSRRFNRTVSAASRSGREGVSDRDYAQAEPIYNQHVHLNYPASPPVVQTTVKITAKEVAVAFTGPCR